MTAVHRHLPGGTGPRGARAARRCAAAGLGLTVAGCGGGSALMHPAHTLPLSTVTLGAGVGGELLTGPARDDIDEAVAAAPQTGQAMAPGDSPALLRGGIAQALLRPGVAPWVGARVGLGMTTDAGATYTGQTIRADARHAFEADRIALSLGLGASGRLVRPGSYEAAQEQDRLVGSVETTGEVPGLADDAVTGFGVDVPVIVGWRSTARMVQIWGGLRGGYEKLWGKVAWQQVAPELQEADLSAERLHLGGLVGLAVGIDPLWAGVELDVAYQSGDGTLEWDASDGRHSLQDDVEGVTVTPTGVLGARF